MSVLSCEIDNRGGRDIASLQGDPEKSMCQAARKGERGNEILQSVKLLTRGN